MNNTGSFGAATGGMSPELQAAISKRAGGNPSGPMGQVSQSAPTFDPASQLPSSSPAPISSASAGLPPPVLGNGAGLPQGDTESRVIIKALDGRLKSLSKIQEMGGQVT